MLNVFAAGFQCWLSPNRLQMFGVTSDNINQNRTVIDVSFFSKYISSNMYFLFLSIKHPCFICGTPLISFPLVPL